MDRQKGIIRALLATAALALPSASALADPPATVWSVTGTSGTISIYDVPDEEGATAWKFELETSGRLTRKTTGTARVLNFRTLVPSLPPGYTIKFVNSQSGVNRYYSFEQTAIEELYWPDTITQVGNYNFYNCTALRICDYPETVQMTAVGTGAFLGCKNLTRFRMSDTIASIGKQAFSSCVNIVFDGPVLPSALTTIPNDMFGLGENAAPLQDGLLVIGGSGSPVTWTVRTNNQYNRYFNRFNITNLVFGAGVSHAGTNTYNNALSNPFQASTKTGSSITNIVIRNPGVFALGTVLANTTKPVLTTVRQYDVSGWITGTVKAHSTTYRTRILAAKNKYWKEYRKAKSNYTAWADLTDEQREKYWEYFNGGVEGTGDAVPLGLTKSVSVTLGLDPESRLPLTTPANVWIVFKEGPWPGNGTVLLVQ